MYSQNNNLSKPELMWLSDTKEEQMDTHGAFRGTFSLYADSFIEIQLLGASWYVVWLDGEFFKEGPNRYPPQYPEYQNLQIQIKKGNHLLAIQVHYEGVETRMQKVIQPFLFCKVINKGKEIPVSWKCIPLEGYVQKLRRISAQFGWVEWCDTRNIPYDWKKPDFIDTAWKSPVLVERAIGTMKNSSIANVKNFSISPRLIGEGKLAEFYGYERDNPSVRFFLRDLVCEKIPQQGIWRRYDLGRVRLFRPAFILDLPAGTIVEFAYSEYLVHDRVAPWINLSGSDSYNLDHFVARGGSQEFSPLTPKGGRFVEIHIFSDPQKIKFIYEKFIERSYHDSPEGTFTCNDDLLNLIWKTGIETYRACAEDALIDNPTRERGQWVGDVGVIGMEIASVGYSDIRLCRRGLVQCAQSARSDGMVAGLSPGGEAYLSSYAAQWVSACLNYWRLTGDKSLLIDLYSSTEKNIDALQKYMTNDGISYDAGWAFIDWGYIPNEGKSDMGLNLHYYCALQDMMKWSEAMNKKENVKTYRQLLQKMAEIISGYFSRFKTSSGFDWDKIGYHRTVLGLKYGFIEKINHKSAIEYIKKHILNCFPNNLSAPRLSDPGSNNPQLITPYFAHYVFPLLIENGEMDFVLDQYRKCWGWALEDDHTTWLEVFDTRWSHCHQWSGCPTWQLFRYVLGLHPMFDKEQNLFDFKFYPGSLNYTEGKIPLTDGKQIYIYWHRQNKKIEYEIKTPVPIQINFPKMKGLSRTGKVSVKDVLKIEIDVE
jgi:hypothetical protein